LADADISRDARLYNALAGFEVPGDDHVADGFSDLIGEGRTPTQLLRKRLQFNRESVCP